MITESELRSRLIARVETSVFVKSQDLPMARNIVALLVPMVLKIIQEEARSARPKSGKEEWNVGRGKLCPLFAPLISNLVIEQPQENESLQMECPAAHALLEDFSAATMEYFDAAGKLCNLVSLHDQFIAAQWHAKQIGAKCRAALAALEKHRLEHCCDIAIRSPPPSAWVSGICDRGLLVKPSQDLTLRAVEAVRVLHAVDVHLYDGCMSTLRASGSQWRHDLPGLVRYEKLGMVFTDDISLAGGDVAASGPESLEYLHDLCK
jgi:hypothetical protein